MSKAHTIPNKSTMAAKVSQVSGKTISAAGTVAALHGAVPSGEVIVGWAIPGYDDQENGTQRDAVVVGDSSGQKRYFAAGEEVNTQKFPVHDPTQVYVSKPSGAADVTNVIVELFYDNSGDISA